VCGAVEADFVMFKVGVATILEFPETVKCREIRLRSAKSHEKRPKVGEESGKFGEI